jgi:hypothetical protein
MKIQYLIFISVTSLLNLVFWYYITVFCAIYPSSASGLLFSFIQGLFIDWFIFGLIRPVGTVVVRYICRKNPKYA